MRCAKCNQEFDPSAKFCPHCGAAAPALAPTETQPAKPSATGQIIISLLNIILCGACIGSCLGLIALVFAAMASSTNNVEDAICKLKTARLLNFIGIIFAIVFILAVVIIAIFFPVTIILELPV